MKTDKLVRLGLSVFLLCGMLAFAATADAPAGDDAGPKERIKELHKERRELQKKAGELRKTTLKENPEVAAKVSEINAEIDALKKKQHALIAEASPELVETETRIEDVNAQIAELRKKDKPKRDPAKKKEKKDRDPGLDPDME